MVYPYFMGLYFRLGKMSGPAIRCVTDGAGTPRQQERAGGRRVCVRRGESTAAAPSRQATPPLVPSAWRVVWFSYPLPSMDVLRWKTTFNHHRDDTPKNAPAPVP